MSHRPAPLSDFDRLVRLAPDEVVTRAEVTDHPLPGEAGTLALITLDNGQGPRRPATLGPASLIGLGEVLDAQAARAEAGGIQALAVTGTDGVFAAGADLSLIASLPADAEIGRALALLGHAVYDRLDAFPVPTFAFVNGTALGGGLELALAADHRIVAADATGFGLPEVRLGLVPGWSGIWRVPHLIGPEAAVDVVLKNPLDNNRTLDARAAHGLGLMDAVAESDLLAEGLEHAAAVVSGGGSVADRSPDTSDAAWDRALATLEKLQSTRPGRELPARRALAELFTAARTRSRTESAEAEAEALSRLITSAEFRRTVYAFLGLVQGRAKRPAGHPGAELAREVRKVGVVGAGLMAGQLALVFAQHLQVPVVMTDMDQERVDRGLAGVRAQVERMISRGRLTAEQGEALAGLITADTDKSVYADADMVIEAVFEELEVKRTVFRELEGIVRPDAILATNTSSLSVAAMAEVLEHPERLVGFHFFNPVAQMPLIEIVRVAETSDEAVATAFELARRLRKTGVLVNDAAAFVVNRVLLRLMGEVQASFDEGTDAHTADHALDPLALPMTPFTLAAMVGLPVAQHVSESLAAAFGTERFPVSANVQRMIDAGRTALWAKDVRTDRVEEEAAGATGETIPEATRAVLQQGDNPQTAEQLRMRVEDALAEEIGLLLDEGVVAAPEDVDLCMILGAGWPLHLGGITPYLDDCGAAERVRGRRFHA
ncbi:3-hydroxyacyl-CoA dehydrogenase [Micrococcus flavus]|uniref:3-hydroxyacyl-CoA dehydrogenase/1,4-dihydroxy-2-naphthoyl-CoA synthase n=1 Tax=Micrococcus flavus TaxID=384602 RepID=A0A4Y8X150_9MICC|nr:3-hydroxyacyl-CoA dehydrogenase NAD-binding domain-containing protein [Micrococcus flavus]MBB4882540.1 3-hydroxyacyl-CoA dehydrogenase/1,4-dihydroxy-2-naphthoyl-CoA synthase [Micrococcus flavus]TFI02123.1 3-hydroxyacyl-CoA dehydrogenase [Micrococcus flavus]GGK38233.1 3-hydroxyacyl-CoA dehydrogenase [Micrococcus flavus]